MKINLAVTTVFVISFATIGTAMARGFGTGGGSAPGGPPTGGFGYQGPEFGYQGPNFGDARTLPRGASGKRTYGTEAPLPDTGTVLRIPNLPGSQTGRNLSQEYPDCED